MTHRAKLVSFLVSVGLLFPSAACFSSAEVTEHGTWPSNWPDKLDPYRSQASTWNFGGSIFEKTYTIRFHKRENFEKVCPHILKVKSEGAPLVLVRRSSRERETGSEGKGLVRIVCPPEPYDVVFDPDGARLHPGPPWPDSIKSESGELPEYVVEQDGKWVRYDGTNNLGGRVRVQLKIVLVIDGEVIDLNRIPLPANTPIIDRRFEKQASGSERDGDDDQ